MLLLVSAFNTDLILKGKVPLMCIFSIRRNNFFGSEGELLHVSVAELSLLLLHPAIFATLCFYFIFCCLCCSLFPHFVLFRSERETGARLQWLLVSAPTNCCRRAEKPSHGSL